MTMPPISNQVVLDTTNPWQMAAYCGAWLYCTEPEAIGDAWQNVGRRMSHLVTTYLELALASMGMKRGNPQERLQAYLRKYNWGRERDQFGQLVHPVMQGVPVTDPATGAPTGETQQVPTDVGEDLWSRQLRTFPRQFVIDAKDAFEMGAPLPDWVLREAGLMKQLEQRPEGKRRLHSVVTAPKYEPRKALQRAA